MPSPFPGMNPYLENPSYWSSVHHWLITEIARNLNQRLTPKYVVAVEVRVYETISEPSTLIGIPDNILTKNNPKFSQFPQFPESNLATVRPRQPLIIELPITETIKQGYLEVRKVGSREVITAIEILSPINKIAGNGRIKYETKRQKILASLTNLVEIDLLRQGKPIIKLNEEFKTDYRILVSPSYQRPQAYLYGFNLQDIIPSFPIPLQPEDPEILLDLQAILHQIYEQGRYDLIIDYQQPVIPSISENDQHWLQNILLKITQNIS